MTEPFPTPQPGYQPAATAPKKKRKKWPWVVGAIVLFLALVGTFGEADKEKSGAVTAASPNSQAAVASPTASKPSSQTTVPIAPAPAASAAPAEQVGNSAPVAANVPPVTTAAPAPAVAPAPAKPQISSSQRNAVRSAQQYLDYSAFSRSGLIEQLEYEGFSTGDATYAVDSVNADWNEQAARSAEQYLDYTSFSKSGLIDQLVYEGYTYAQAEYGANAGY
ncbi:Ltp family lipoprotein [Rhodococcus maanshanensis]|uniref:Host cell surface-exposed lipoprotein n=1 Tax=Rhodococcus maanshanensis TaxID=183556 RepID=A0A1H7SCH9_9NOCA|nr:Ltp family lipoprotein [Rhodococcus maanshanensis]SEL70255.1 Host cell surface-exposed lipoprotein [Rhodococcus maanshanensis]